MLTLREFDEIVIKQGFVYSHCISDAGGVKIAYFYKYKIGKQDFLYELQYALESGLTTMKKFTGTMLITPNRFDLVDFIRGKP